MKKTLLLAIFVCVIFFGYGRDTTAETAQPTTVNAAVGQLNPAEARAIAKEAYIYGFPMVVNYKTMYMYAANEQSPEYKGPFNFPACEARLYTPEDKAVVTPNADTPYCMFWVDIRQEPMVLSVPEMEPGRYYSFQLIDLYTHNFAYIGTLTTGNGAGRFMIAASDWQGPKPDGIDEVIRCETDFFFLSGAYPDVQPGGYGSCQRNSKGL